MPDPLDATAATGLAEAHRHAYNAAFEELGLSWYWDCASYGGLRGQGPDAVRSYIETEHPYLLRAYDAEFLVNAIETAKARRLAAPAAPPWLGEAKKSAPATQVRSAAMLA